MLVFVCVGTSALYAQGFSLFVEGGGSSLFDNQSYTVYGSSYGSRYNAGRTFAAGAEIPLTKAFSLEGSYGFVRNDLTVTNFYNSSVPNQETAYAIRNQRISFDVLAHARRTIKELRPYLALGVEFDNFAPTSAGAAQADSPSPGFNGVPNTVLKPDNKFGFNFGGGVDLHLTRRLLCRFDVRDHITGSPTFGLPPSASSVYATYYPISGLAHDLDYSVGIVIRFGK